MRAAGSAWRPPAALAWAALTAFAASLAFQKIRAFDYWWHLRTGQLIAETGAVPRTDPFSFTVPGARWIDIHWLHQLGLWGAYTLGGHAGVIVAKIVLVVALVAIVGSIGFRRERAAISVVALALMLLVACDRFMPRPELPTFVCLAAVLALLDRFERRGDAWVFGVVAVQLVWVNLHGLFALGLALLGIHLAAEVLRPLVVPGGGLRTARIARLAAVTALSALASLANPNGLDGALYPIQQLGMIGAPEDRGVFGSLITELLPTIGAEGATRPLPFALFAILAAASFAAMLANWRRLRASDPLVWVAFLYLALGAQRNTALFAIVAAPIAVRNANDRLDVWKPAWRTPRIAELAALACVVLLTADAARGDLMRRFEAWREPGFGVMEVLHPVESVDWIERERPPGPICHHMADGGYLIWRLYPDYPVMVDGRLEVYGAEKFLELNAGGPESFRALDARYHCGVVLLHYSLIGASDLLHWLYLNSNWRLAHVDESAALFVRQRGDGPLLEDVDVDAPDLFPPLDGEPGVVDQLHRMARTNFYMALQRYEPALALWKETLDRYPDLPSGAVVHAFLLHQNGFTAAAEAILRRELEGHGDDAALLARVGELRLETGDRDAARALLDRALALDPTLPNALFRRAVVAELDGDLEGAVQLYLRVQGQAGRAGPLVWPAAARVRALAGSTP